MENKFFAAQIDTHISTIDLHAADNINDALLLLEKELFRFSQQKIPYVKIIYGIGSGNLGQAVHDEIKNHPLVQDWEETGEGGSCFVIL